MELLTNANTISQSSTPNGCLANLLARTRSKKAMVEITVRIIIAAKISGPRLWVSHGAALAQTLWVDIRASVRKRHFSAGYLAQSGTVRQRVVS